VVKSFEFWERFLGRFDHNECRTAFRRHDVPETDSREPLPVNAPLTRALRSATRHTASLAATSKLVALIRQSPFWHRNS
jgi:hypothetical protein